MTLPLVPVTPGSLSVSGVAVGSLGLAGVSAGVLAVAGASVFVVRSPRYPAGGGGASDDTAGIQGAIDDAYAAGGGVVFLPAGVYLVSQIVLRTRVVLRGVDSEFSVWGYASSPQDFQTVVIDGAGGHDGPVVSFPDGCVAAGLGHLTVLGGGRVGVSLAATTDRGGNRLRNVYVNGASTGVYVGAAETRVADLLVMGCSGDGVQVDALDCQIDTLICGYNGGNGVVVGVTSPATSANVLRGHTWDVFNNTLDGIQINGDAHRLVGIQSNNNGQRGVAFLACTKTVIVEPRLLDNGREYDGGANVTRYPDVEWAHPTAGNSGCGLIGGSISSTDANQSVACKNSETTVTFPSLVGVAFAGAYSGGSAASNLVSSINAFSARGCTLVPDLVVPQAGSPAISTRPNGSADQMRVTDGSGNAWAGFKANGSLYRKLVTLAYAASITPDASNGNYQKITATDSSQFTINAPTGPPSASQTQDLFIEVHNSSGGDMGAITWNAAFVFAGIVWTNPANGSSRVARFQWNGSKWIAVSFTAADF